MFRIGFGYRGIKVTMLTLLAIILMKCFCLEGKLFGDHVCQTEINEPREVLQWELINRTVRTYKWCMNVPPRCSVYSNKVFNETKFSVINITKSVEACCEGFYEQNSYCISMCQDCENGLCLKGTCICQNGWKGSNCDSRLSNSGEDIFTTKATSSSTINLTQLFTTQTSAGPYKDTASAKITSTSPTSNDDHYYTFARKNTNLLSPTFSTSSSTNLQETTFSSTTSLYSSIETLTKNFNRTTTTLPIETEKTTNFSYEKSPKTGKFSENNSLLDYGTTEEYDSNNSEEELAVQYSTDNIYLDTTVTQQTVVSSTLSIKNEEIIFSNSEENSTETSSERLDVNFSKTSTTPVTNPQYPQKNPNNNFTMLENPDSDVDYRELGGQSFEEKSMELPKVVQNGIDKNHIQLNVLETTRKINSFHINLGDNIEETNTQNVLETIAPVLDKPNILKDEKENSIFKEEDLEDSLDDFTEERYQKRSSSRNYSQNTQLTKNEPDNNNLIYSVCAASATTVLILIVAIIIFTLRNARKKIDKNKAKKDVATVAVYTTSIFHSPLPDPPTFENPTYLSTPGNNSWNKDQNEEMIEVQEFNVVFQKPLKNPKLDTKQYLYDHPPSTGSYRASSEVDTLSQYNLSHKSLSGIILEPLYDEIPSRDNPVESNDGNGVPNDNNVVNSQKNSRNYLDNNSLYVNTFGRTMF